MPEPLDPRTLEYYGQAAPSYRASGPGGVSRQLDSFLQQLQPASLILELGCGGGRDAEAMINAGFRVEPTDGLPEIARQAEERLGTRVRVMRFDELEVEDTYDGVWASASLIHVPRPALSSVIFRIHRALRPCGVHGATFKSGGAEGRDSAGRYYNYPSADELTAFYADAAAWATLSVTPYVGGGFETGQGPWLVVQARRGA